MDFHPRPANSIASIDVTLMDIVPYDFKGFLGFPERSGWKKKELTNAFLSPSTVSSVLQSWLYFGLLSEFLQEPLKPKDFTFSTGDPISRPRIKLDAVRARLLKQLPSTETSESESLRRKSLIDTAVAWLREVEQSALHESLVSPLPETTLSIRMLLYTLLQYTGGSIIDLDPHPLVSRHLKEHGWCPSHIHQVEQFRNDVLAYYLSCLRRPNARGLSHKLCPPTNCEASSTTLSKNYIIQHTHPKPTECSSAYVHGEKVRDIIRSGGIPLVAIERSPTGLLRLQVHAATPRDSFVALSHVWADGLGNPFSNALPQCQIRRLESYLTNIPNPTFRNPDDEFRTRYELGPISVDLAKAKFAHRDAGRPMLFWMDTLCIPVSAELGDEDTKELKRRAIDRMADIYGSASHVLVLDSGLQELRIATMQPCEILAHIAFSNWKGRSWTLQEGALNPSLYFQFADGALNFLDLPRPRYRLSYLPLHPSKFRRMAVQDDLTSLSWAWKHKTSKKASTTENGMIPTFEELIYKRLYEECIPMSSVPAKARNYYLAPLNNVSKSDGEWVQRLVTIWNALALRTTTKDEDLPAIFANLLGLDTYKILSLPSEQRLRAIIFAGNMLPVSLLYKRGPRLKPGDNHLGRWIPTLLARYQLEEVPAFRIDSLTQSLTLRTEELFDFSRPTFLLPKRPTILRDNSLFQDSKGSFWQITCHREPTDELGFARSFHQPAFIIDESNADNADRLPCQAFCVRILNRSGDKFKAVYDCPCTAVRVVMKDKEEPFCELADKVNAYELIILSEQFERIAGKKTIDKKSSMRVSKWVYKFFYT